MNAEEPKIELDLSDNEENRDRIAERAREKEVELQGVSGTPNKHASPDKLARGKDLGPDDIQVRFDQHDANYGAGPDVTRFEMDCYLSPVCTLIRRFFNWSGAILALISASLDILYMGKVPFVSKGIYAGFVLFWVMRLVITVLLGAYYICAYAANYRPSMAAGVNADQEEEADRDEDGKGNSRSEDEMRRKGHFLYGSMFFLFYGGFYRVLPSTAFAWELGFGYAVELFVGLIPSLFFMVSTNAASDVALIGTQSAAIIVKVLSLLMTMGELGLMAVEIYKIKQLQEDDGIISGSGFAKPTEEERRERHCASAFAYAAFTTFVVVLVVAVGMQAIDPRSCDALDFASNLEMGTCQSCLIDGCVDCSGGSKKCNQCEIGMTVIDGYKCADCDDDPALVKCVRCNHNGRRPTCLECADGYRNVYGQCIGCSENCRECTSDGNRCVDCAAGFYLDSSDTCRACSDTLHHCLECSGPSTCSACDLQIASRGADGRCTNCNTPWQLTANDKCECLDTVNAQGTTVQHYTDVLSGNVCKTCGELIDQCEVCDRVTYPTSNTFVELGYSEDSSSFREPYVECIQTAADNSELLQQTIEVETEGGVVEEQEVIVRCDDLIEGCESCSADGNSCDDCLYGYYRYMRDAQYICGSCGNQDLFGECNHCDASRGCLECAARNFHFGYKCYR